MNRTATLLRRQFLLDSAIAGSALCSGGLRVCSGSLRGDEPPGAPPTLPHVEVPTWAREVTRMSFLAPSAVPDAARIGVQVVHGNAVWPYYPLRRDGGGLSAEESQLLRDFSATTHRAGMRLVLGLPPFPSIEAMRAHPEWRIAPDASGEEQRVVPTDNLGTRLACNLGPWGDYLIEICAELLEDFGLDGFSFDGNYHPPLCLCEACQEAYQADRQRELPERADLDQIAYREYLAWRGERLEDHYARLQRRLKGLRPDAVVMTWTVNAGRYGHFLHSPRAMPTRLNRLIDLPMQEWWLDETNRGASVAPSFGAEYLAAVAGYGPCGCEPYLMSRGNPYSPDSLPPHERMTRSLLTLAHGSVTAHSIGWPGGADGAAPVFAATRDREPWLTYSLPLPWAGMLVSEQTRQFYAYRDIAERFLPHVFGAYRCLLEERLPVRLLNDWDLDAEPADAAPLSGQRVLLLPNAAALSDRQVTAIRQFVEAGGGLVATGESSLCDELGRPRRDFALAELFGASYRGRPRSPVERPPLDANFAIALDESYWRERAGAATLAWDSSPLWDDESLRTLVPGGSARFKGPQVLVEPARPEEVVARLLQDGPHGAPVAELSSPGIIARQHGQGRVVYLAAAIDAALWSYAYPYQRMLLARAIRWAANVAPSWSVEAPRCVQAMFRERTPPGGARQQVVHLFNDLNTTGGHGAPDSEVPLREETVPIHGIRLRYSGPEPRRVHLEPGGADLPWTAADGQRTFSLPPLERHAIVVVEHA